jgi:hypothetical protein
MQEGSEQVQAPERRRFFKELAVVGGAAVVLAASEEGVAEVAEAGSRPEQAKGYQLSSHVKAYYETLRI